MFDLFARDIAIDLGTANTLVYIKGKGIVFDQPSVVAIDEKGGRNTPVAIGSKAKAMLGRTPEGVKVVRPIRTGVIADFDIARSLLEFVLGEVLPSSSLIFKPRIIIGIPSGITAVEKRAIEESVTYKARDVKLIDEAMAAAIGCNLPVTEATASMIVDIGGGTTDVAVISLKDIVYSLSVRQGGDSIDQAIINHLRRQHRLLIGEPTAELVKITIGAAHPSYDIQEMEVRGRSLTSGSPSSIVVTGEEIREAITEVISAIISAVRQALENTPPELSGDIISSGLALAGGGALLKGLDKLIEEELGISAVVSENPLAAVVLGAGKCLENPDLYKNVPK